MANTANLRIVGNHIETLVQDLGSYGDPRVREKAEQLVRLLMDLYGAGLARILEAIRATDGAAEHLRERFAEDELIASLLMLHDLHPLSCEDRVRRALDRVRPTLSTHGGDVTLLDVRDGIVFLRLEGSCNGCPSSTITMKMAIQCAIEEAAPEVTRIEVEGTAQDNAVQPERHYQVCPSSGSAA